jgi:hypothetical protein
MYGPTRGRRRRITQFVCRHRHRQQRHQWRSARCNPDQACLVTGRNTACLHSNLLRFSSAPPVYTLLATFPCASFAVHDSSIMLGASSSEPSSGCANRQRSRTQSAQSAMLQAAEHPVKALPATAPMSPNLRRINPLHMLGLKK